MNELPRLRAIEKAAQELLAAREAINDTENLMTMPYAPMHRRLNEAWTALRTAVGPTASQADEGVKSADE